MHQKLADWSKKIMWLLCDSKTIEMLWLVSSGKVPVVLHHQLPVFLRMSRKCKRANFNLFKTSNSFQESHHRVRLRVCVSFLWIKAVFYFSAFFLFHNRLLNRFLLTKTVFHFPEFFLFHNKLLSRHNSIKWNTPWKRNSFLIFVT